MVKTPLQFVILGFGLLIVSLLTTKGFGDEPRVLEVKDKTHKIEVAYSQIGYRDTLIFYTFVEQKAVLRLQIDNKDTTFPFTAKVYTFADEVTEDGIKKWLNNQHSDGLFADAAQPEKTYEIPAETFTVTDSKLIDRTEQRFGKFANYSIDFEAKEYTDMRGIHLKPFTGKATIHVIEK